MAIEETGSAFSILIVDDEPRNIRLIGKFLKKNNYDIASAMNGKEAFELIAAKPFDLILLDVMMPVMDGYEICKILKSQRATKHIPIIFLTAKTETEDIVKGFKLGASDYVTKPFRVPELLARIQKEVELKTLRGFLPICAECKSIRDDKGIWNQLESYLESNFPALFSHSLCPDCSEKLYGDKDWYIRMKKAKKTNAAQRE